MVHRTHICELNLSSYFFLLLGNLSNAQSGLYILKWIFHVWNKTDMNFKFSAKDLFILASLKREFVFGGNYLYFIESHFSSAWLVPLTFSVEDSDSLNHSVPTISFKQP